MSFALISPLSATLSMQAALSPATWSLDHAAHAYELRTYKDAASEPDIKDGLHGILRANRILEEKTAGVPTATTHLQEGVDSLKRVAAKDRATIDRSDLLIMASALLFITRMMTRHQRLGNPSHDLCSLSADIALALTQGRRHSVTGEELFAVDCALSRVLAHEARGLDWSFLSYPQRMANAELTLRTGMASGRDYWEIKGYALPHAEGVLRRFYPGIAGATLASASLYALPSTYWFIAHEVSGLSSVGLQYALALYLEDQIEPALTLLERLRTADDAEEVATAIESYERIMKKVQAGAQRPLLATAELVEVPIPEKVALFRDRGRLVPTLPQFLRSASDILGKTKEEG